MRLAFCGKGGSGKSTICSLFARYVAEQNTSVLVVDGDINQHVGVALGFDEAEIAALPKMGIEQQPLREYFTGTNKRIAAPSKMIEPTPAGTGSGLVYLDDAHNPILQKYSIQKGNIRFMAVGGHEEKDIGTTCYHRYTGMFGIFLNHVLDTDDQFVLGDMCAGADPFASSGLASRFDAIVLVVEPTLKSVGVYDQCRKYGDPYGIKIMVVGNKVENDEDIAFIRARVGDDYIGSFKRSNYVRQMEKGVIDPIDRLEDENLAVLKTIQSLTGTMQRDWQKYQQVGYSFLKQAADAWATHYMGTDIIGQYDPTFYYEDYLPSQKLAA